MPEGESAAAPVREVPPPETRTEAPPARDDPGPGAEEIAAPDDRADTAATDDAAAGKPVDLVDERPPDLVDQQPETQAESPVDFVDERPPDLVDPGEDDRMELAEADVAATETPPDVAEQAVPEPIEDNEPDTPTGEAATETGPVTEEAEPEPAATDPADSDPADSAPVGPSSEDDPRGLRPGPYPIAENTDKEILDEVKDADILGETSGDLTDAAHAVGNHQTPDQPPPQQPYTHLPSSDTPKEAQGVVAANLHDFPSHVKGAEAGHPDFVTPLVILGAAGWIAGKRIAERTLVQTAKESFSNARGRIWNDHTK